LINIDIEYWVNCTLDMTEVFLPCSEDLWRASRQEDWETIYKSYLEKRKLTDMLKFGVLKASQQVEQGRDATACSEDLKDWSSRIDGFGVVVLMAALTLAN
jgi:hypothetical protein